MKTIKVPCCRNCGRGVLNDGDKKKCPACHRPTPLEDLEVPSARWSDKYGFAIWTVPERSN